MGNGVVGNATGRVLQELKHHVVFYDVMPDKSDIENEAEFEYHVQAVDFVFVCMPTPTIDGSQDISYVTSAMQALKNLNYKGIVVLRSTVLPGTCAKLTKEISLRVVHMPEFLREKHAFYDVLNPDKLVVSGPVPDDSCAVLNLWHDLPETNKIPNFLYLNYKTSEFIKYASNCFLASKVAIANEFYDMCRELKIDYDSVVDNMYQDRRIGKDHLRVTKERGFGGHCFPKDTQALSTMFPKSKILKTVIEYNNEVRKNG